MLYSTWINQMRSQTGDTKRAVHVDWTGDGSTSLFQMPTDTFPVLDDTSTYTVRVGGVSKTETTDYTLDKTTGTLTLVSTPSLNATITIDSVAVYLRNADWQQITNDVIKSLGDDYWKEFVDGTLTSTANMLSLDLTTDQPDCIAIYDFSFRTSSSENWRSVSEVCNWRYDRDNNVIYIGVQSAFPITGTQIRLRGLKKITQSDTISDTLDLPDKFHTVLEYGSIARYWRWRYKSVVELISKMSTESSRTPLQELIMLSDRFDRLYEVEKAKLKPGKPARIITPVKNGGGNP